MALLGVACSGLKDKIDKKLYAEDGGKAWRQDSVLMYSSPPVLFRIIHKGDKQLLFPIALLSKSPPSTLRMATRRGWSLLDISMMFEGHEVTPVREGFALPPVKMQRGMWEISSQALDSLPGCKSTMIPVGLLSAPSGTELLVANYKLPTGMKVLSPGEIQDAIRNVPLLVTPTVQISSAQLSEYTASVHQIPRVGAEPAILMEYHDFRPVTDTSVVAQRRPRHLFIVLEKGVYGYRPSWTYTTTGSKTDRPILRLLDIMDLDMDGRAEIVFQYELAPGVSYTMAYQQWNDTWREYWRRGIARCDDGN